VNHRNADAQAGRVGEGNELIPQTASKGKSKADRLCSLCCYDFAVLLFLSNLFELSLAFL